MKSLLKFLYVVSILMGVIILVPLPCNAARKLLVVGESAPPFEFVRDGKVVGIDVDIARQIFKKLGLDVEFRILPWAKAWNMVTKGEADAVFTASRSYEREPYLYYPNEDMWKSDFVFFVRKDRKKGSQMSYGNAKGQTIGIIRGNSYHSSFWDSHLTFEESPDEETNLKKLAEGKIDLYLTKKIVGLYSLKLLGLGGSIACYDNVLFSKGYPMPFASKSSYPDIAGIAGRFEKELVLMKKQGEYQKIVDAWLK
jgi:polar amino acid transport system substrate-binding protein